MFSNSIRTSIDSKILKQTINFYSELRHKEFKVFTSNQLYFRTNYRSKEMAEPPPEKPAEEAKPDAMKYLFLKIRK